MRTRPDQHTASWYSSVELTARVREGKKVASAAITEIRILTSGRTNLLKNYSLPGERRLERTRIESKKMRKFEE
jgi:hypothetical protein